ncbi:phosphatase PAP2 family protein [Aneurinibacillus aneurinilyticus]|jgi:membrane-associated phospholipid phosphatase|uniref:Phosphatase PAP2 family protein n=2 Tax=Aneurinibacillus aneurinilyticus TaxID=1391 RepID=A0A848D035_ANEAE|nr:phosphatase PAP2 family protein [Aneurinibacillus aneurinilyticus]ERI08812.1 PAP2 family protein [Aneurinibacillus aneurinilyticus ATCC 12856]MCI1695037.1 phosphatase PAP2 family protein [Aneurinibacillus aneurinilyticus]MED0706652.1 phosphatase PAP2 family protein [Aneurinibacillus aneurinilyticus]MED0723585.1 phosphatase PAP2 family protein [Aneurinibacillus aneurinilyticus]MED0731707.1 phosphatase PAP2 family protein [Aneurinibacillus aneurinilyticus]
MRIAMNHFAPFYFRQILLHEYFMSLLFLQILVRLALNAHFGKWFVLYVIVLGVYWILIYYGQRSLAPATNRIRLLWNIIMMNFAFTSIKEIIPIWGMEPADGMLASIDHMLVGGDLSLLLQKWYSAPLTEVMSIGYLSFLVALFATFIIYGFRASLDKLALFCAGIFTLYGIGITGYTLIPGEGPFVHFASSYTKELTGYFFTEWNAAIVKAGSAKYDVFPSLHVGVGLFLLMFYYAHNRRVFYLYLVPFVFIVLSTLYLRYHYFIDLIVGACFSVLSYHLAKSLYKKEMEGAGRYGVHYRI